MAITYVEDERKLVASSVNKFYVRSKKCQLSASLKLDCDCAGVRHFWNEQKQAHDLISLPKQWHPPYTKLLIQWRVQMLKIVTLHLASCIHQITIHYDMGVPQSIIFIKSWTTIVWHYVTQIKQHKSKFDTK